MGILLAPSLLAPASGVKISNSLLFNGANSPVLYQSLGTAGTSSKKFRLAFLVKRVSFGATQYVAYAGSSAAARSGIYFDSSDRLQFFHNTGGSVVAHLITTMVFRDPAAWYAIECIGDTDNAHPGDRMIIKVNGVRVIDFDTETNPSSGQAFVWGTDSQYTWGASWDGSAFGSHLDAYLTNVVYQDGSFGGDFVSVHGEGVAAPKGLTNLELGDNGSLLTFTDASTAAALGYDSSGNGNNWTTSGIATSDQVEDTPTQVFPVFNPLAKRGGVVLAEGNLAASRTATTVAWNQQATIALPTTGKWYFELTADITTVSSTSFFGIVSGFKAPTESLNNDTDCYCIRYGGNTILYNGSVGATNTTQVQVGDTVQVAYDADAGKVWLGFNDQWLGSNEELTGDPAAGTNESFSGLPSVPFIPVFFKQSTGGSYANGGTINFGQKPFARSVPTGFKKLHTGNLPKPAIKNGADHLETIGFEGNGGAQTISGEDWGAPDQAVMLKNLDSATDWAWFYSLLGVTKRLSSSRKSQEVTDLDSLTVFNNDGFDLGGNQATNKNLNDIIACRFKLGAQVSNTVGSIPATVSANAKSGVSTIRFTGTNTDEATIGTGLLDDVKFAIFSNLDDARDHAVYHSSAINADTEDLILNSSSAKNTGYVTPRWSIAHISPGLFGLGSSEVTNGGGDRMLATCFCEVAGFSKIGVCSGNGSVDGPFVYCGFRPRLVILKTTDTGSWHVYDTARSPYNVSDNKLYMDEEYYQDYIASKPILMLSNGFKIVTNNAGINQSGDDLIFIAFAENPFGGRGVLSVNAR